MVGLDVVQLSFRKVPGDDSSNDDNIDNDDDYKDLNDIKNKGADQDYEKNDNIGHEGL